MYSGSTFNASSGYLLGAHQKIDRVARRHLETLLPDCSFPKMKAILHFEGDNGPDAIKRKSPAKDEPWHYIQPFDLEDNQLLELLESHYDKLGSALKVGDEVRAAFEAAWLAHAVVDGLTPAHHYPYEEKLIELRGGRGIETRTTIGKKLILPGENAGHQFSNNWKMWGPKGLFTTHAAFELGVAMVIAPLKMKFALPRMDKIDAFQNQSLRHWFRAQAQDVARLELYDIFYRSGWTVDLARRVRRQLAPALVQSVTLVWYGALLEAGLIEQLKSRIIAGSLGGRQFASPRGHATHPMSDKIRGALFNALGDISGLTVLDAFAGSGALSFEAISRGATHATAIDNNKSAQLAIQENIKSLMLFKQVKLTKASAAAWLSTATELYDVVLLDPPYDNLQLNLLTILADCAKGNGLVVCSLPPNASIKLDGCELLSVKTYGDSKLVFFRKTTE